MDATEMSKKRGKLYFEEASTVFFWMGAISQRQFQSARRRRRRRGRTEQPRHRSGSNDAAKSGSVMETKAIGESKSKRIIKTYTTTAWITKAWVAFLRRHHHHRHSFRWWFLLLRRLQYWNRRRAFAFELKLWFYPVGLEVDIEFICRCRHRRLQRHRRTSIVMTTVQQRHMTVVVVAIILL